MEFRYLSIDRQGPIAICTLNNPPSHTLTAAGVSELLAFVGEVEADSGLRVVVFTGADPDIFIRHYEVGELAQSSRTQQTRDEPVASGRLHPLNQLTIRLASLPCIFIAALNGSAAGGGFELALGCDFRLAAQGDYRFGLPETGLGIIPGAGGTQRFTRLLGTAKALELILLGQTLSPEAALSLGLLHRVFNKASFMEEVLEFATVLAERAPIALAQAKRAVLQGAALPLEQGLLLEQAAFAICMRSEDAANAMAAWLEGESYSWKGR